MKIERQGVFCILWYEGLGWVVGKDMLGVSQSGFKYSDYSAAAASGHIRWIVGGCTFYSCGGVLLVQVGSVNTQ